MKTALLIHGYNGVPRVFDYFKSELEKLGYEVIMPSLPTQEAISFDAWERELMRQHIPPEISVLIAHSVGNEFMIRYCAKYNVEVGTYIALAGFVESFVNEGRDDLNKVIAEMQCGEQEINKFKEIARRRYAIYSDNDHIVPYEVLRRFPLEISATPIMIGGIGHMGSKSGLTELAEVIKVVESGD